MKKTKMLITPINDPTLDALDRMLEEEHTKEKPRDYLGASSIGQPCPRRIWYGLHRKQTHNASTIRKFIDGHRTEQLVIDWLGKLPGITLETRTKSGGQIGFVESFDFQHAQYDSISRISHKEFRGHYDGIITGIYQAPKTPHILEIKCVNEKRFKALQKLRDADEKSALQKWSEEYYAQAVVYMYYARLKRHYLVCATPGGRDLTSCRTNENPELAEQLIDKARKILSCDQAPVRVSDDPKFWLCNMCPFKEECHGTENKSPLAPF